LGLSILILAEHHVVAPEVAMTWSRDKWPRAL
jgi:hypothetical protein